jgi:hypothetical protein
VSLLYSRTNAKVLDDPEYGHFEADPDGGFDFPDELSDRQHRFHYRGKPAWETEDERNFRLHGEESDRRRDPETLYNAVAEIAKLAQGLAVPAPAPAMALPPEVTAALAELAELRRQLADLQALAAATAKPAEDTASPESRQPAADPEPTTPAPAAEPAKPAVKRKPPAAKTAVTGAE